MVIYSPDDQVVRPQAIARAFSELRSERKRIISFLFSQDPSQHVLAGNLLSPGTTDVLADKIYHFVRHGK